MNDDDVIQIIKVGAGVIFDNGNIDMGYLDRLVQEIIHFKEKHMYSPLVVSGAIRLGAHALKSPQEPTKEVLELQRCAGVGQPKLMQVYDAAFSPYGINTSQLPITVHNLQSRVEQENIRNRIHDDLRHNIVTLINYNDVIDFEGITRLTAQHTPPNRVKPEDVRDNDMLTAYLAPIIGAQRIIMVTHPERRGTMGGASTKNQAIKYAQHKKIDVLVANPNQSLYELAIASTQCK